MSLSQRTDAIVRFLLALSLWCIAAWRSPFFGFDAGVLLVGAATACVVHWQGSWSWSFLTCAVVKAYFFRCIVLCLMGSDTAKLIAVQDIGMGLVAVSGGYAAQRALGKDAGRGNRTGFHRLVRDGVAPSGSSYADLVLEDVTDESRTGRKGENAIWSPLQFTLRALSVFTVAWSGLLAVGVMGGIGAAGGVLLLAMSWFLVVGFARLIASGTRAAQ